MYASSCVTFLRMLDAWQINLQKVAIFKKSKFSSLLSSEKGISTSFDEIDKYLPCLLNSLVLQKSRHPNSNLVVSLNVDEIDKYLACLLNSLVLQKSRHPNSNLVVSLNVNHEEHLTIALANTGARKALYL
jgi:hypothetical protein